jgi:hypothetical protein
VLHVSQTNMEPCMEEDDQRTSLAKATCIFSPHHWRTLQRLVKCRKYPKTCMFGLVCKF